VLGYCGHLSNSVLAANELLAGLRCGEPDVLHAAARGVATSNLHGAKQQFAEELSSLLTARKKRTRIAAFVALGAVLDKSQYRKIMPVIESALLDKDKRIRSAAAKTAAHAGAQGKDLIPNLLENIRTHNVDNVAFGISLMLRRTLKLPRFFLHMGRYRDPSRNSLRALAKIGSIVETERIITELSQAANSTPVNPVSLFLIFSIAETISEIGSNTGSPKALESLFRLIPKIYEDWYRGAPAWILESDNISWRTDFGGGFDLKKFALTVAKRIEPSKVTKELKAALESNHVSVRRLAVAVLTELPYGISSELLPSVLKLVVDEDTATRETSWEVISRVYAHRGVWKSSDAATAGERPQLNPART
jgi:hypothetical protein